MSSDQKPSRKRLMLLGIGGLTLAADAQQHQALARRFLIRRHG
ncbi:hypothetical protein [Pseudomonas sp. FSL R10-0765]|nr:hypothetical protein [Pseudomonas sp. FSL R10-0765]